jgi:MurNAc alpha-1-phosphate uridylyltransferase
MTNQSPANTTVFILAAGRGERMRPLTDNTPKPLLKVNGKCLIDYHIEKLIQIGFKYFIINIDHLGEQIIEHIGDGSRYDQSGITFQISDERQAGALETAGGIHKALDMIKSQYFLCLNADIWTDYPYADLLNQQAPCLVLVPNPEHNKSGDFTFDPINRKIRPQSSSDLPVLTFSGVGFYSRSDFIEMSPGKQKLAPILNQWMSDQLLHAVVHDGIWHDIGTPERLAEINSQY